MIKLNRGERFVRRQYEVGKRFEAGIKLLGSEVKAVKEGKVDWRGSFVRIRNGEAYIVGLKIFRYSKADSADYNPERTRKLLLNKSEIDSLSGILSRKGIAIFPLKVYSRGGIIKVELGIGRGKKEFDHRKELKKRQMEEDINRELAGVTSFA